MAAKKKDLTAFKFKLGEAAAMQELALANNFDEAPEAPVSEPPIDRDPLKLDADFRTRLMKTLDLLKAEGLPFKFHEGFRTVQRRSGCTDRDARRRRRSAVPARSSRRRTARPTARTIRATAKRAAAKPRTAIR